LFQACIAHAPAGFKAVIVFTPVIDVTSSESQTPAPFHP